VKSHAENKAIQRARMRDDGYVLKQIWCLPKDWDEIKAFINNKKAGGKIHAGE